MITQFNNVDDILSNINTNRILIIALAVLLIITWAWLFSLQEKIKKDNDIKRIEEEIKEIKKNNSNTF